MLNFLRKKENSNVEKKIESDSASFGGDAVEENSYQFPQPDFNKNIKDLIEAIKIQRELGGRLKPEDVERITGMKAEDFHNYLSGQEFSIKAGGEEVLEEIEAALSSLETESADSSLKQRLANNKGVKAAFVALMLFAKFAPQAQAGELKEIAQDKFADGKEVKKNIDREPDNDKVYQASSADFKKANDAKPLDIRGESNSRFFSIELANYFDTDEAEINDVEALASSFKSFLDNITPDNAQSIIDSEFKLFGSSDERPTSNWGGSNELLTEARLSALESVLKNILNEYDFKGVPSHLAEQIKAKTFIHEMPASSTGPEKGVTYITDLDNPETGTKYTPAEVAAIKSGNPEKYKALLDDCRKINFSLSAVNADKISGMKPKMPVFTSEYKMEPRDPDLVKLQNYNHVMLLFDNSPSVGNSYSYLGKMIASQDVQGLKLDFSTFSNKLDGFKTLDNTKAVAQAVKEIKFNGNTEERALDVAMKALKKMTGEKDDKGVVFIMTDEALQEISWQKIQEIKALAAEKNSDVFFYYGDDRNHSVRQISLNDLERGFEYEALNRVSGNVESLLKKNENKLNLCNNQISYHEDIVKRLLAKNTRLSEDAQKSLLNSQQKIAERKAELKDLQEKNEKLTAAWEKGDILALFAEQKDLGLRLNNFGKSVDFNPEMTLKVPAENLGFVAVNLQSQNN